MSCILNQDCRLTTNVRQSTGRAGYSAAGPLPDGTLTRVSLENHKFQLLFVLVCVYTTRDQLFNPRCFEQTFLGTTANKSLEMHQHAELLHRCPTAYARFFYIDLDLLSSLRYYDVTRFLFLGSFYVCFDLIHGLHPGAVVELSKRLS